MPENLQTNSNQPVWKIQQSHPELALKIMAAFNAVTDPEIGLNINQLGLVRQVELQADDTILITMILTTPFCPYGPHMLEETRTACETASGKKTQINYGDEMWDQTMMEDGLADDWGLY